MSESKMHQTFEAFYGFKWMSVSDTAQQAWAAAWQASRESVVITLPPSYPVPDEPEEAIDDSHMDAYHAANGMRHACAKFIETAGLRVKQ